MKRFNKAALPVTEIAQDSVPTTTKLPILYIEDNETNFDIARSILESHFSVTWAKSPRAAREELARVVPSLILLDIEFSGESESGLDFLAALRESRIESPYQIETLPVVILTAYSSAYNPHQLRALGADQAIFKPIDPDQLIHISHVLANHSLSQEINAKKHAQKLEDELDELREKLAQSQVTYETTQKVLKRATERLAEEYESRTRLIAERDALQAEITAATKELIKADRLATLGSLVAGVAHDITNPTNLIAMNKEILYNHIGELESVIFELLGDAEGREAEVLVEMFKKVFSTSREALSDITLGLDRIYSVNQAIRKQSRQDDEKVEFPVHELLKECITIVRARSKAVTITLEGDENLAFIGFRSHLGQVFMNLLSNAIDAAEERSKKEGNQPEVILGFTREDSALSLWVTDNGYGVPRELQDKIFEPFFTTKESGKGTGLGMPIILKIIAEHNGTITLRDSEPGVGAAFDISLPFPQPDSEVQP